ncbi:hypothetical protein CRENPOLYSF1_190089 [Crenothrix polyspora]|uniref:Uncharacterized protein n=1 Tax=Crenothrix polyspora TaxID=360316 RepID=A0A1R4H5J7_9GAMM|nr:hypothetical protein CRENPOLYSF1_190089 [Crenothrix polyspora]
MAQQSLKNTFSPRLSVNHIEFIVRFIANSRKIKTNSIKPHEEDYETAVFYCDVTVCELHVCRRDKKRLGARHQFV